MVNNCTMSNAIAVNTNSISCLKGITKLIVPKDVICPEYMNQYNSWTAPTTPTTGAQGESREWLI